MLEGEKPYKNFPAGQIVWHFRSKRNKRLDWLDDLKGLEYKEPTVLEKNKGTISGILSGAGSLEFPELPDFSFRTPLTPSLSTMKFGAGFGTFLSHVALSVIQGLSLYTNTLIYHENKTFYGSKRTPTYTFH
ncbi:hypothetical protein L0P88_15290 [Muricauda sp. SCSIO 64092]|uniref:hypothetical protein n=1 Tax=Allomuricauda sp. SCSIO 64092 TaxID=2908842 RepID=UPI001FF34653|nr:hypothetical protein [Muricauda sp. SCSIO 64092]UOY05309.1 hypothetical protein L0P88_15290 [Muricauda sp. SCSIO 64092]